MLKMAARACARLLTRTPDFFRTANEKMTDNETMYNDDLPSSFLISTGTVVVKHDKLILLATSRSSFAWLSVRLPSIS